MISTVRSTPLVALLAATVLLTAATEAAAQRGGPYQAPADIEFRTANIMSEGVRMHAELFSLRSLSGTRLPTVIQAHGWGGVASQLRADAVDLARAGYLVISFDYRGWGESDSRVILTAPAPRDRGDTYTAEITQVRGVVNLMDQTTDWFNAIHWAMGEPMVDPNRIGIRGSSMSGGHVVYVAAFDPRVKAFVSQVGATNPGDMTAEYVAAAQQEGTRRTRGAIGYPEPLSRENNLTGQPVRESFLRFNPNEIADRIQAASLFIVAENEELYSNETQTRVAYERIRGPKEYVVIPGITHYGIYTTARAEAIRLAIDWFDRHLKP